MGNPGIFENTVWRIDVAFTDPDTGENTPVDDVVFAGKLWKNPDDDEPVFTWREAGGGLGEGNITHGPNTNQIALIASPAQHAEIVPGRYTWKVYRIDDDANLVYATGGRAYVGEAGELTSQFEIASPSLSGTTLGVFAIPGTPGAAGDDGDPGPAGADGSRFYTITGTPPSDLGSEIDVAFSKSLKSIFSKDGGTWDAGTSLKGDKGDQGDPGLPGDTGPQGPAGANFDVDATGLLAARSTYDAEAEGFAFLATDTGDLYIHGASAGQWSDPIPFRGPAGIDAPNYDSLALLKAADLAIGTFARTNGYFAAGDGGAANYAIVAAATGTADNVFYANMTNGNQVKLILADPTRIRVKQAGVIGDGDPETDDTAKIAVLEGNATLTHVDLQGLTIYTNRRADTEILKNYFDGTLNAESQTSEDPTFGTDKPVHVHERWPIRDTDLISDRTKSPVLDMAGRIVLWAGTSIPQEGGDFAYPNLTCTLLGATCVNVAWAGSHAGFELAATEEDAQVLNNIKGLSMTEDDRLAGFALWGVGSIYDDDFNEVTKGSKMTCDWRIDHQFATQAISVVVLDHNHNDRGRDPGTLEPEEFTITGITKGETTQITVSAIGSLAEGDGVAVVLEDGSIPLLNHAAARVMDVTGSVITLNIDSSAYDGTFTTGTVEKLDRSTLYGALEFLIHRILRASMVYGDGNVVIILCPTMSEYTTGSYDKQVYSNALATREVARKHGLAFYDVLHDMEVTARDHSVYFPDNFHPTDINSRYAIAYHWARWFQGGAGKIVSPNEFLPTGDANFFDQAPAIYSRFLGGFGTAKVNIGDPVVVLDDDFSDGDYTGWTQIGIVPTIGPAPWDADEFAVLFTSNTGTTTSQLRRNVTLDRGRVVEFDFWLPEVDNLLGPDVGLGTLSIFNLRSGGAYYALRLSIRAPSHVVFSMLYFETANNNLHALSPAPGILLAENTKYHVKIEAYQGSSADEPGRLIFYLNGEKVGGPYALNDFGQGAIQRFDFGINALTTENTFQIYTGNIVISKFAVSDIFTGNVPAGSTVKVKNGLVTGYS